MAVALTQEVELTALVEHGRKLLDRLLILDSSDPKRAWEAVVELDALLDRLRELRPAPAFRQPA
jgi:hypothetical protein